MNIWKSTLGRRATYKALMEVFIRAGRRDCAATVVDILKEGAEYATCTSGTKLSY